LPDPGLAASIRKNTLSQLVLLDGLVSRKDGIFIQLWLATLEQGRSGFSCFVSFLSIRLASDGSWHEHFNVALSPFLSEEAILQMKNMYLERREPQRVSDAGWAGRSAPSAGECQHYKDSDELTFMQILVLAQGLEAWSLDHLKYSCFVSESC
jgi:hypothetical protein